MEKLWLKQYQDGVPETINPDEYTSIVEMFLTSCRDYAKKDAFVNLGCKLTFEEVEQLSAAFAAYCLNTLKLKKGDRLAIMMPNLLQYPIAMFGAMRAGLTVVNVNPLYTATELRHQLMDSGTACLVVVENFAKTVEEALPGTDVKQVIITRIGDLLSFPKSNIVNLVVKYIKKMVPDWNIPNTLAFNEVLKEGKKMTLTPPEISADDIAYLQYTGGTTGGAKGAILTHRNMVANVLQAEAWINPLVSSGQETIITALPLYHIFSLTANCLTFFCIGALNVLVTNPRDIPEFVKILSKYSFTAFTGVNTLFNALLKDPNFSKVDFSHLKLTLGGGMAVQRPVAERWAKVTGAPLLEAYGLTEASPAVCMNPMNLKAYNGSIGLPISSTEVSIWDEEGHELGINQPGELCIRGPQVMKGYWQRPEETSSTLTEDGWLKTGDIAEVDEKGFIKIVDRKKDMIVISGFNVYPNEVEEVIAQHEDVLEVAVIGVASPDSGEMVKAYVVTSGQGLTEKMIRDHCRKQLTAYKVPKQVEFRSELPKTNVGKIMRRALREEKENSRTS